MKNDSLLVRVPEAMQYLEREKERAVAIPLFPKESFRLFTFGVLATSETDSQGEAFALQELEAIERKTEEGILWVGMHHDPLVPPVGRVIAAKVFYDSESDVHFVAAATGVHDKSARTPFQENCREIEILKEDDVEIDSLPKGPCRAKLGFNPHEIDVEIIEEILADAPECVDRETSRDFRKAADPLTIISISAALVPLLWNPFMKKFAERYGEEAANASMKFFGWLKNRVFPKIAELPQKRILFVMKTDIDDCEVDFVIDSKSPEVLVAAYEDLWRGKLASMRLVENIRDEQPQHVVYEWKADAKQWLPVYAVTVKSGVITDQTELLPFEQCQGMSLGGTVERFGSKD